MIFYMDNHLLTFICDDRGSWYCAIYCDNSSRYTIHGDNFFWIQLSSWMFNVFNKMEVAPFSHDDLEEKNNAS